jgi:hypothetical protein
VGVLGHLGSHVVANYGVQAGHEHQTSEVGLAISTGQGIG